MTHKLMKHEIIKKVEETRQELSAIYGVAIQALPVKFTLKGQTAGQVRYGAHYNFNLHIAENNQDFIDQTVPHEVAHQVAVQVFGDRGMGHGDYWKSVMRSIGLKPKRCHNYKNVKLARKVKRYDYSCGCNRELTVSSIRYNRALRGTASYKCRCGRKLDITKAVLRRG